MGTHTIQCVCMEKFGKLSLNFHHIFTQFCFTGNNLAL